MGLLAEAIRQGIQLPDTRPLDLWAEDNIVFPGSPISEKFQRENVPMLIEPLRAWDDPLVRAVSVLAGVQGCKTGFEQIAVARAISCDPGNVLVTAQTDDEATFYAKTKLLPCLRESKATKDIIATLGREDMTKEHILLASMFVQIQGPSLSGAQSKTIWKLINDEMWRWKKGTMDELLRRTNAVRNKKVLSVSQGGEEIETETGDEDWCEWGTWWHQGTQKNFEVLCHNCEKFFSPETRIYPKGKYIVCWDDNPDTRNEKTGEWNWKAVRETVRMQCPYCDHVTQNRERDRKELVQNWLYRQLNDNPSPFHESYRYSGYTLWWRDWADIVEGLLRAQESLKRGDIEPLKKFTQKEEARFWTLGDKAIPIVNTKEASGYRIETYDRAKIEDPLPRIEDESHRFGMADMQDDRFPLVIRAFSNAGSRKLYYGEPKHIEEVDEIVRHYGLQTSAFGLDVGNWKATALEWCYKYKWTPLRGRDVSNFTRVRGRKKPLKVPYQAVIERLTGKAIYKAGTTINVWEFANTFYKDMFARLRAMPNHQIPDDVSQAYIDSMASERKDPKTGIYKVIGDRQNHAWDCEIGITFFASLYKLVGAIDPEDEEDDAKD